MRNLYLDWADENGNIIKSSVNLTAEGVGIGHFDLPMDSKTNFLQLNAYTAPISEKRDLGYYKSFAVVQKNFKSTNQLNVSESQNIQTANKVVQIDQNDPTTVAVILNVTEDKEVIVKGRMNTEELFEEKLTLKANKRIRIPFPIEDLKSGLLQIRVYDGNNVEIAKVADLIGIEDLVLVPQINIAQQSLNIQLPEEEVVSLSLSIVQPELPYDTVHAIWNDVVFNSLALDKYPQSIDISLEALNSFDWRWDNIPEKLTEATEENVLTLKARIDMKTNNIKKFVRKTEEIKSRGSVVRGVSVSSQALNEEHPSYKLYQLKDNLEIEMPDMTFFGDMFLKTRMVDPELDGIPFTTSYKFRAISAPTSIYRPAWENFSIASDLKSKWLPIYDDYASYLANMIDTVTVTGNRNLNLVRKYDAMNQNLNDESEIIDLQLDRVAHKYSYTFEDYLPIMKPKRSIWSGDVMKFVYFLNNRQVEYEEVRGLFMSTMAYVRVYHNPRAIAGYIPKAGESIVAGIQLVELPSDELRKVHAVDEKIEGYVEPRTFDQIGKMPLWWNPFLIINSETGTTTVKLPVELKGKRVNIQGVTNSGKLVYYNEIVN